jgi:restriction system protein
MALWLVRAGRHMEHMQRFLDAGRIYLTWHGMKHDLGKLATRADLYDLLVQLYPESGPAKLRNHTGQIWPYAHDMKPGDWVVVPYKGKPALNVAEITGPYAFDPGAEDPYYHSRTIKWIAKDIPRSNFDQDLLYSFGGAFPDSGAEGGSSS